MFFYFPHQFNLKINVVVFLQPFYDYVYYLKRMAGIQYGRSGFYVYRSLPIALSIYSLLVYEVKPFSEKRKYIHYCTFLLFTLSLSKRLISLHFIKEKIILVTLEDYLRYICINVQYVCSNVQYVCIKLNFANIWFKGTVELN